MDPTHPIRQKLAGARMLLRLEALEPRLLLSVAPIEVPLDGNWDVQWTTSDLIADLGSTWSTVQVPSHVSQRQEPYAWFRRSVTIPSEWQDGHVFLDFGGVKFVSEVYVNGAAVGGHYGGWESFELDVSSALSYGAANEIIVRVEDVRGVIDESIDWYQGVDFVESATDSVMAPVGSQDSLYGIWQPVNLSLRNDVYIDDATVVTSVRNDRLDVTYSLRNLSAADVDVDLAAAVMDGGAEALDLGSTPVTVPAGGSADVLVSGAWADPHLWTTDDPYLYSVEASLTEGAVELDADATRFGFREFWTDGTQLLLNGVPVTMLGSAGHPAWGGDLLTDAEIRDKLQELRDANITAFRLHANIWPENWYSVADEMGMLVVMESAIWCHSNNYALSDPQMWQNWQDHWQGIIADHKNHPSVVMYSIENEILHVGGSRVASTEQNLGDLGRFVKATDPTRPIMYDGDEDPDGAADVINLHYPYEWPAHVDYPNATYWLEEPTVISGWPYTQWQWDRTKPLYIGEFLWTAGTSAYEFTGFLGDDAYVDMNSARFTSKAMAWETQIEAYRILGVAGMCPWTVWESGDFPNEQYDAVQRAYEPNAAFVREYDTRFFSGEDVARTVDLFNDTLNAGTFTLQWYLDGDLQGQTDFAMQPDQMVETSITLAMPTVSAEQAVNFEVRVLNGTETVYSRVRQYSVFPQATPAFDVPAGAQFVVYGDDGVTLPFLQSGGIDPLVLGDLSEIADSGADVLIVAAHALDPLAADGQVPEVGGGAFEAVNRFVEQGGTVVVLEQDAYPAGMLPASLSGGASTIAFSRAGSVDPLAGLDEDAFEFWRGDNYVNHTALARPTDGGFRVLVDAGTTDGLSRVLMMEVAAGQGRYVLSQLLIGEKFDSEPIAAVTLERLVDYAAMPPAPSAPVGLLPGSRPLAADLDAIGVQYVDLTGLLATAELSPYSVLVVDGTAPELVDQQATLAAFVAGGGTVVLHGLDDATLQSLDGTLPDGLTVRENLSVPVLVKGASDPAVAGISNEDLHWIFDWSSDWRQPSVLSTDVLYGEVGPAPPAIGDSTVVEVETMALLNPGAGQVNGDYMQLWANGSVETAIDIPETGTYLFGLTGYGTPVDGGYPDVVMYLDGETVGHYYVTGPDPGAFVVAGAATAGAHTLRLSFVNDAWDPEHGEDRNVWMDEFYYAPYEQGPEQALLQPAGLVRIDDGAGSWLIDQVKWDGRAASFKNASRYLGELLHNLSAEFTARQGIAIPGAEFEQIAGSNPYNGPDGDSFRLVANGEIAHDVDFLRDGVYEFTILARGTVAAGEYPALRLNVGGVDQGELQLQSGGWEALRFTVEVEAGVSQVGVQFTNDLYDPVAGEDRNVWIGEVRIAPQEAAEPFVPAAPDGYTWEMIWNDEFDGTELDPTKWSTFGEGPRRDGYWTPDAVSLDGSGHLVMEAYEEGGEYYSGAIHTKGLFEYAFGFYTARIQLQSEEGHWPAFWIYGDTVTNVDGSGQDGTEIDIMETPWLNDQTQHALHWDGYGDYHQSVAHAETVPDLMEGWHDFALLWTSTEYVFYIDGVETWRTSAGGVSQVPEYMRLTDEVGTWAGDIANAVLPDEWYVDHVRVYDLVPASGPGALSVDDGQPGYADSGWDVMAGGYEGDSRREGPAAGQVALPREILVNGGFDDGLTGWQLGESNGATGDVSVDPATGAAQIVITNPTDTNWHLQFRQAFDADRAALYSVTYTAWASVPVTIQAGLQQVADPYASYYWQGASLTTTPQTFSFENVSLPDVSTFLKFNMGDLPAGTVVHIDDASVVEQPIRTDAIFDGMSYTPWSENALLSPSSDQSIADMAAAGVDTVALNVWWFQDDVNSTVIEPDYWYYSASTDSVIHAIQEIHANGMAVMLKPMVDCRDGTWRANINPSAEWFAAYADFINYWADIAESEGVEVFSVGCEFNDAQTWTAEWRDVVAGVRDRFWGALTYSADHSSYQAVEWWDDLDYIGIDAYFALTGGTDPTIAELRTAWEGKASSIETWLASSGLALPVVFTEVGYRSEDGANMHPWDWGSAGSLDLNEQADCYQALVTTLYDEDWWGGAFWWNWETDPSAGGLADTGYTPQNKPTEELLTDYYSDAAGWATWTFDTLAQGDYEVYATWSANSANATNAPYEMLDGSELAGTATADQSAAPDDAYWNGRWWESLGVVSVESGSLTVMLTNYADGYVIADAVRLVGQPTATGDAYTVSEDNGLDVPAQGVLSNDSAFGYGALTAALSRGVEHGSLVLNADGSFAYTPDADYNGPDSFDYVISEEGGGSASATVDLTVLAVNDAPTLTAIDTLTGAIENEDCVITYGGLAAAADEADVDAGDTVWFCVESVTAGALAKGGVPVEEGVTLLGPGESLVWSPPADQCGTLDAFTVTAWDGTASSSTPVQVSVQVEGSSPYVGTIAGPGAARVYVYDMDGGDDVDLSDINVVFTDGNTIDHIDLNGAGPMSGLGLVVTGADTGGTINDYRTTPGDVAFFASTGQFLNIKVSGNLTGYNLNGLTLQDGVGGDVIAFAADIDGDGQTGDLTALYVGDYVQGNLKVQGTVTGDVLIAGANAYNWSLKVMHVYGGAFAGDLRSPGKVGVVKSYGDYSHIVDVGPELRYFLVYDGDFSGQVSTTGPMYAFLVSGGDILGSARLNVGGVVQQDNSSQSWGTAGEAIHFAVLRSGVFRAGAIVQAGNGSIFRVNLPDHETDNGGEDFGVWAGGPYRYILLGSTYISPGSLPYVDGDFHLATV